MKFSMESEENCQNYKRVYHWISWFEDSNRAENFRTFKIALNILYYIYIIVFTLTNVRIFSRSNENERRRKTTKRSDLTNRERQNRGRSCDWTLSNNQGIITVEGTEFTDSAVDRSSVERFNVSSNDNCYIILWEFAAFEKGKISSIDSRIQMALSGTRFWSAIAHE